MACEGCGSPAPVKSASISSSTNIVIPFAGREQGAQGEEHSWRDGRPLLVLLSALPNSGSRVHSLAGAPDTWGGWVHAQ